MGDAGRANCSSPRSPEYKHFAYIAYKMWSPKLMLVALWLVLIVSAEDDVTSLVKRRGRHYCGETLNRALMLLCDSIYKRSDMDSVDWMTNEPFPNPFLYDERPYFPFRPRNKAVALIPRQYKRRGVADECCSKPCTVSELSTYCGARPRR